MLALVIQVWLGQLSSFLTKLQSWDYDLLVWTQEVRIPKSPVISRRARPEPRYGRLMVDLAVQFVHEPMLSLPPLEIGEASEAAGSNNLSAPDERSISSRISLLEIQ